MRLKITGILGFLAFCAFSTGFLIFLFFLSPDFYNRTDGISLTSYNLGDYEGVVWIRVIGYIIPGVLVSLFSLGLLYSLPRSNTNKLASIMFFVSGINWASFGIYGIPESNDFDILFIILRSFICLTTGALGFFFISSDISEITNTPKHKWIMFSFGILIIINGLIDFLLKSEYPSYLSYIIWMVYFLGICYTAILLLFIIKEE